MNYRAIRIAILTAGMMSFMGLTAPAMAQGKKLSDRSVKVMMNYAWGLVPHKFTTPTGKVIITDKTKPELAWVPIETAREVIRVGWLSGRAQNCDLREAQVANYHTLMRLERAKKKWTDQQILFINQLHTWMVVFETGRGGIVSDGTGEAPKVKSTGTFGKKKVCSKETREKVGDAIVRYVRANPPPPKKKADSSAPQAQPASTKSASAVAGKTGKKKQ